MLRDPVLLDKIINAQKWESHRLAHSLAGAGKHLGCLGFHGLDTAASCAGHNLGDALVRLNPSSHRIVLPDDMIRRPILAGDHRDHLEYKASTLLVNIRSHHPSLAPKAAPPTKE